MLLYSGSFNKFAGGKTVDSPAVIILKSNITGKELV